MYSLKPRCWRELVRKVTMGSSFDCGTRREKWSRGMMSDVVLEAGIVGCVGESMRNWMGKVLSLELEDLGWGKW